MMANDRKDKGKTLMLGEESTHSESQNHNASGSNNTGNYNGDYSNYNGGYSSSYRGRGRGRNNNSSNNRSNPSFSNSSARILGLGKPHVSTCPNHDHIILAGSCSQMITDTVVELTKEFDMKDLGQLWYFLGLQITYQFTGLLLKDDSTPYHNPEQYRTIVGALQYLTFTRPDITFSMNQCCQFMHDPMNSHVVVVKRILQYLSGTIDYGLSFKPGKLHLQAYSDANWAAIALSSNPVFHSRVKHIEIDYHLVRERVIRGDLNVSHVSSKKQFADILTKGLAAPLFQCHCFNLMLGSSKHEIAGECKDVLVVSDDDKCT
ncbi:unnamed protein product [Malus baccata var. baccata]